MIHKEWFHLSSDKKTMIYSQSYTNDHPIAIVQIAHGMSERSERYKAFMMYLADKGYLVCANDHLGHGKSSQYEQVIFANHEGGFDYMIEDIHLLFKEVKLEYPTLPIILIGQSMGSIMSALYADRYDDLSKLILMGTPSYNFFVKVMKKGLKRSVRKHGYTRTSKLWNKLIFGNIPEDIEGKVKHYGWLTRDENVVRTFVEDKLSGHLFTDAANLEVMSGLVKWGNTKWGNNIPNIPVLFIAGTKDKIAGYGKGANTYYQHLKKNHPQCSLKLIKDNRHEVLNELNKDETYQVLLDWLNAR